MSRKPAPLEDHRVFAVYDEDAATTFRLRRDATLGELCELLVAYSPASGKLPQHVEVSVRG